MKADQLGKEELACAEKMIRECNIGLE